LRGISLMKLEKVTLYAEQKKGNENVSKTMLIGKIAGPQELETKVLDALKRTFT
jgi:hypothetical protein